MAIFIDDLGVELFTLIFVAVLTIYMTASVYINYRKGENDIYKSLVPGVIPLTILGVFILIMGFFGEFTWSLPGSFNILFDDPYIVLGVVVIGFTISIQYRKKLNYMGLLALMAGIMAIWYGAQGYGLGMTKVPIDMLGMYVSFGVAGIFTYPVTLMLDRIHSSGKVNSVWVFFLLIFWICFLIAIVTSGITAFPAIGSHLASPP